MHACLVLKCNVTKNKMFQILSAFISIFFFFFGCNLVFDLVLFYEFMSVAPRPESQSLLSSGDREYTGTLDLQRCTLSQIFLDFFYTVLYMYCISRIKFTSLFLPKTHRCLDHQSQISTICIVYMPYITLKTLPLHLLHVPGTYSLK